MTKKRASIGQEMLKNHTVVEYVCGDCEVPALFDASFLS